MYGLMSKGLATPALYSIELQIPWMFISKIGCLLGFE